MTGSGDIEGLEDTMANRGMTELEALLFHGMKARYEVNTEEDGDSLARYLAQFLVDHLPKETDNGDDHPAERPSSEGL